MGFLDRLVKGKGKKEEQNPPLPVDDTPDISEAAVVTPVSPENGAPAQEPDVPAEGNAETGSGSFFARLKRGMAKTRQNITEKIDRLVKNTRKIDDEFFEELEEILIQADVGVSTTLELVDSLKSAVKQKKLTEAEEVKGLIKEAVTDIMKAKDTELKIVPQQPTIMMVVGVNGVGKTTTIAKLAFRYKQQGQKVIIAAADTFRAAAIDQLQVWADRTGVELIKHQEGADPGAVVFDAVNAARARKADFLIIDTAGRLHTKVNLMEEISKVKRVIQREYPEAPHEVLLVLDATTGQNAISQANLFKQATGVTGIALTKLDGTAKGGIVIAIARELDIPVKLIGIGESLDDLRDFSAPEFVEALFD